MPQPFKKGTTTYQPLHMKQRPQHALGIALVVSEWSALEEHLFQVFSFALFAFHPHTGEASKVARNAWDAMDALKAKLDFIQEVCEKRLPEDLLKEFLTDLVPELRKRAGERNRVVHGQWYLSPETKEVVLKYSSDDPMIWTEKDFENTAQRIIDTSNKIATFWHKVQERLIPDELKDLAEKAKKGLEELLQAQQKARI
jgi:hypothetical protein